MTPDRWFAAPGLTGPLCCIDANDVISTLEGIMLGWRLEELDPQMPAHETVLSVRRAGAGWLIASTKLGEEIWFDEPVSAACAIVARLLQLRMLEERNLLCLHAAAVEVEGGLVVMPCRYRAGKSLLAAAFAATGRRIFNDDVVMLDPASREAVAPGIAPRLRHPLPAGLDVATGEFIERHRGASDRHYLYLDLPDTLMARQGERAAIRAFVLLDRRESGAAKLARVGSGDLLRQLIWQNFARAGTPERILETLAGQVEAADCLQLTYSSLTEARQLLSDHFSVGGAKEPRATAQAELCPERTASAWNKAIPDLSSDARLRRNGNARRSERAGEVFLTSSEGGNIVHLNALASCLWTLLAEPLTYREVLATFRSAFPTTPLQVLDCDLRMTIANFQAEGLLHVELPAQGEPRRLRSMTAAAAMLGILAGTSPATASAINGCEGRDISALLAPESSADWRGEARVLGSLRFSHNISLSCNGERCQVTGGLSREDWIGEQWSALAEPAAYSGSGSGNGSIASLPFGSAPPHRSQQIGGAAASNLAQVLEQRGFRDPDGMLHYVWVDYGTLAGQVNLRARSEIVCTPAGNSCSVATAILAHVSYSERTPCPQATAAD